MTNVFIRPEVVNVVSAPHNVKNCVTSKKRQRGKLGKNKDNPEKSQYPPSEKFSHLNVCVQ